MFVSHIQNQNAQIPRFSFTWCPYLISKTSILNLNHSVFKPGFLIFLKKAKTYTYSQYRIV